jgi:pimeloyl-ACP methyl ester carboxylesterase
LARTTRVCAYDRAGQAWSDLPPEPHDTQQNAQALYTLLRNARVEGPYVLVGHSLGGLYAQMSAELHPTDVVGMALIEGTFAIKQQYHLFPNLLAEVHPLYRAGSMRDVSLAVVLGSEGDGSIEAWQELFAQQAALSTAGAIYRIEVATHISLVDRQEHAEQTRTVIATVIEAAGNR